MKELTKKVVILNNFSSPYVSQAIIILKDYNPKLESRAIADAETIVSRYIERTQKKSDNQTKGCPLENLKILKNIDLLNFDCVNMLCNQISFLNYLKLLSI